MAAPALAQQPQRQRGQGGRGGFGGGVSAAMLLANKGVQEELKLTPEEADKAKEAADKIREKYRDDLAKLQDLSQEERREKSGELMKSISADTKKALADVLKPDQMKRLHQIELQARGGEAFAEPDVQKTLKLSDEQKEKLKTISEDSRKEMREARQGARDNPGDAATKIAAVRKASNEKAMGVLTDDQKKEWKEMTGAPFEVKLERRRRNDT